MKSWTVFHWFCVLYVSTELNVHHFISTINQFRIIVRYGSLFQFTSSKKYEVKIESSKYILWHHRDWKKKPKHLSRFDMLPVFVKSYYYIFRYLFALIGIKLKFISLSNRICQIWICWFRLLNLHIWQMLISATKMFAWLSE